MIEVEKRSTCPNALHDWPLPNGYVNASVVAAARIANRWSNPKCSDCLHYGWIPGSRRPDSTNPVHAPFEVQS